MLVDKLTLGNPASDRDPGRNLEGRAVVRSGILLLLGEPQAGSALREFLALEGFTVHWVTEPMRGIDVLDGLGPDLVVLDISGDSAGSLELLARVCDKNTSPVVAVAESGDIEKRIAALELGADACVGNTGEFHELAARIRAVLRRRSPRAAPLPRRLHVSGVVLDPGTREVSVAGRPISLTTIEFDILETLMQSAGSPVSREKVIRRLYNRASTGFDRSVNVHISNLRKKLETGRVLIKAVRGTGYQFCIAQAPSILEFRNDQSAMSADQVSTPSGS